jgi:putative membrane-bound dehydrogenase-like protein
MNFSSHHFSMKTSMLTSMMKKFLVLSAFLLTTQVAYSQIPPPDDAPKPLSPTESMKQVKLPEGFRLQLVASEPLTHETTSVCWDTRGRMLVGELHGYNLEGQYDIDELNKTGKLDTKARRIHASEDSKKKAAAETYGTVKLLIDTNNDGVMDKAEVWIDHIAPVFGICAARDGIIVAAAPDILYLADKDGDGKPEVRETLFTGFSTGPLERGMNCPAWYFDNWIYIGKGHGGSRITGPHLKTTVNLPASDFRIRADGTAIEAVTGATRTIGHAITDWGHRIEGHTQSPAIMAAPLPWNYLSRNPDLAVPSLEQDVNNDLKCYPISEAHPWRAKRFTAKGYDKVYNTKETTPNGFYTSSCSPLIYRDTALPGLTGQLFTCEPAQNFIHRSQLIREDVGLKCRRVPGEETHEFLASTDAWFHPMYLTHAPDGSICIVDFYREIIEDYSAVPRHLQQQYGVVNGLDKGRIYKLIHDKMPAAPSSNMSLLSAAQLVNEVASPFYWRRETARRLLVDRNETAVADQLALMITRKSNVYTTLNVLYALEGLKKLSPQTLTLGLQHKDPAVRIHSLQLADNLFNSEPQLFERALTLQNDTDPNVVLQFALSIGESSDKRVARALETLAVEKGNTQFFPTAILSSASKFASEMLDHLFTRVLLNESGNAQSLIEPLCGLIVARGNVSEVSKLFVRVAKLEDQRLQTNCMRAMSSQMGKAPRMKLSVDGVAACRELAESKIPQVSNSARTMIIRLGLESTEERATRLADATKLITDVKTPIKRRISAVRELAEEDDPAVIESLMTVFPESTPQIREIITEALFTRRSQFGVVLDAIEKDRIPLSTLTAIQRAMILDNPQLKARAEKLFKSASKVDDILLQKYVAALKGSRNNENGAKVFTEKCANCHQVKGIGFAVGPNLDAEFQRAEETYVKDILAPNDVISPGFVTYTVGTKTGRDYTGLLSAESASSVTLKKPRAETEIILRRDIEENPKSSPISLMPENFAAELKPNDVADVIAWIRSPQTSTTLIGDNLDLLKTLNEGPGNAEFVPISSGSNRLALRITPPQKYSGRIKGWEYKIREKPQVGEYRYLRITWKSDGADGMMIELADNGKFPVINSPRFRYYCGRNISPWMATEISSKIPTEWTTVTRDLWKDFGDSTITGIAPTAMNGPALFDKVELLQSIENKK